MTAPLGPARRPWYSPGQAVLALLAGLLASGSALAQGQPSPTATIHFGEIAPAPFPLSPSMPPLVPETPGLPGPIIPVLEKTPTPTLVPVVNLESKNLPPPQPWEAYSAGNDVLQANCPSCGLMPPPTPYPPNYEMPEPGPAVAGPQKKGKIRDTLFWGCTNCGVDSCRPGGKECYPCCHTDSACERFFCNLYHCICCPDPCYEGKWQPIADSAFFTECARPVSQTRLRWDAGVNLVLPDRSEYFWARADGQGRGPRPVAPFLAEPRLTYHDLSLYTEVGSGLVGVIFEMPYRSIDPELDPHAANFADMNIALKTMIFDCELLQVAMMMRTYMPVGNSMKGLGTGHVSLEPGLIFGIKLHQDAYLQGQIAEWIPMGGDPAYAGAIFHYHFSVNQVLCRITPDVPVVGMVEFGGYSFQDGAFTDPILGPYQKSSGETYLYLGAGLRMFVCDRIDFGTGFQMALTDQHFADQLYRSEFRFRY